MWWDPHGRWFTHCHPPGSLSYSVRGAGHSPLEGPAEGLVWDKVTAHPWREQPFPGWGDRRGPCVPCESQQSRGQRSLQHGALMSCPVLPPAPSPSLHGRPATSSPPAPVESSRTRAAPGLCLSGLSHWGSDWGKGTIFSSSASPFPIPAAVPVDVVLAGP